MKSIHVRFRNQVAHVAVSLVNEDVTTALIWGQFGKKLTLADSLVDNRKASHALKDIWGSIPPVNNTEP